MDRLKIEEDQQAFDICPYINDCALDIICGKLVSISFASWLFNGNYGANLRV